MTENNENNTATTFHPDEKPQPRRLEDIEGAILIHSPNENMDTVLKDLLDADVLNLNVYQARGLLNRLKHQLFTSE